MSFFLRHLTSLDKPIFAAHMAGLDAAGLFCRFTGHAGPEKARNYAWSFDFNRGVVIGGFLDGHLIGVAEMVFPRILPDQPLEPAEIAFSVDPEQRGHGYGRRLFQAILEEAQKAGLNKVQLYGLADNKPLMGLLRASAAHIVRRQGEVEAELIPDPALALLRAA